MIFAERSSLIMALFFSVRRMRMAWPRRIMYARHAIKNWSLSRKTRENKNKFLIGAFGWYGAVALIGAYTSSSFGIISPESLLYQLVNVTGAIGIIVVSLYKRNYQPAVLNVIWTVIGLVTLAKILF